MKRKGVFGSEDLRLRFWQTSDSEKALRRLPL